MAQLEHGRLFALDGGLFRATYDEEEADFALWTYQGFAGSVVARTGFDIAPDGALYHRVYDVEAEEYILIPSGYTVDDLEEVPDSEVWTHPPDNLIPNDDERADDNPW